MSRTALLLIDLQEDYLARPGLSPAREMLVQHVAAALADARASGMPVFHIRTDGGDPMPHRRPMPEVVPGTPGAAPPSDLVEHPGEMLFTKRFFSAFDISSDSAVLVGTSPTSGMGLPPAMVQTNVEKSCPAARIAR